MKPYPRQILNTVIKASVDSAIEKKNQQYGRQLATILERHAVVLRLQFGGTPLLEYRKPLKTPPQKLPEKDRTWCFDCGYTEINTDPDRCPECQSYDFYQEMPEKGR